MEKLHRLSLANQYKILAKLYPEEAEHYNHCETVLRRGFVNHYSDLTEWIDDEMPTTESRHVLDVLQMFSDLSVSYHELSDKDGIDPHDIRFPGFDGNEESAHLDYATYFIDDMKRFQSISRGGGYNSHFPTRGMYSRMLEVWQSFERSKEIGAPFTKEQIEQVIAARTSH